MHRLAMDQWITLSHGIRWETAKYLIYQFDIPADEVVDLTKEQGEELLTQLRLELAKGEITVGKHPTVGPGIQPPASCARPPNVALSGADLPQSLRLRLPAAWYPCTPYVVYVHHRMSPRP
jgi:hypothetical protein